MSARSAKKTLRPRGLAGASMLGLAALGAPAIPGLDVQRDSAPARAERQDSGAAAAVRDDLLPRIDDLLARHDCLACHAPERAERIALDPTAAPVLAGLADRVAPDWLIAFLEDPRGTRPDTAHPHQLIAFPEASRRQVAIDLAHHLLGSDAGESAGAAPSATVADIERGRTLFHSVGCVACHGPRERVDDVGYSLAELAEQRARGDDGEEPDAPAVESGAGAPRGAALPLDLHVIPGDLPRKYDVGALAAFLEDPVAVRPSGHCPSMSLTPREARSIAYYLLLPQAQRRDGSFEVRPGLARLAYEIDPEGADPLDRLDEITPVSRGATLEIDLAAAPRDDHYALRFTGWLEVPGDGEYTFHLRSDDGSRLIVDGEVVVDNGGVHPARTVSGAVRLFAGKRAIVVDMFERASDAELSLEWEGPGLERGPLPPERLTHWSLVFQRDRGERRGSEPFRFDAARAARGADAFAELDCAACHGESGGASGPPAAPRLERLAGSRPGVLVCLRPEGRYDLAPEDAGALLSAFVEPSTIARDTLVPARAVERALTRRRCYSCHPRDDVGGVHPDLAPFFQGDEDAELGDQGRFPPVLTQVGRKLRPGVLDAAVHGHERVRPYLATRMPRVGDANLTRLADQLRAADLAVAPPAEAPACGPAAVDEGRRLAGVRGGLGCVQCHDFRGTESLGVRAVDLGEMHRRLRFDWFRDLLLDPSSVDLEARMASFWIDGESPVVDVAGGDRDAQIERLWCWLAEGDDMAPPPGLDTGPWAFEVHPSERTRLVSVFMRDVSPRVICVGTPAGVHAAFDAVGGRVAHLWRGRFLNAMGTWKGRAGGLEEPGSNDRFEVPAGPALLARESLVAPWSRTAPARMIARELAEDGTVTFEYSVGELRIRETLRPVEVEGPPGAAPRTGMRRSFRVQAPPGGVGQPVVARIAAARAFRPLARGTWHIGAETWPIARVLGDAARTARVVRPRAAPVDVGDAVLVDDGDRAAREAPGPDGALGEELRAPVLLRPDLDAAGPDGDPRNAPLVGEIEWEVAW